MIQKNNNNYILSLQEKYEIELKDYIYIHPSNVNIIKKGGYIRYINIDEEIKWGGAVINIININNLSKLIIQLKNTNDKFWKIKFNKYYVFYKNHVTYRDTFKNLFIKKANLLF